MNLGTKADFLRIINAVSSGISLSFYMVFSSTIAQCINSLIGVCDRIPLETRTFLRYRVAAEGLLP